jgi:hypothetical protein
MKATDIKRNLNKPVIFREHRYGNEHKYILTGATIRLGQDGFYYQAEITDTTHNKSVVICGLDKIEEVK